MRAMILAAGFGTRLKPLSDLRAKPALPVRGRPVISLLLEFLAGQGCRDVMINLHHLPKTIRAAVAVDHPPELQISWSEEPTALGTGGGIRRAAEFLRESEICVVLAGDMLLDIPLKALVESHRTSGRQATLILRRDSRESTFGTIGVSAKKQVTRIGQHHIGRELEQSCGLFTGVRIFSREILNHWPDQRPSSSSIGEPQLEAFEDLRDWLIPAIETRGEQVGAEIVDAATTVWEPVGTPAEYLQANLTPPNLPSLGGDPEHWTGEVTIGGTDRDVVVSRKADVPASAELERCVVWDGEYVPPNFVGKDGVYAGGQFRSCLDPIEHAGSPGCDDNTAHNAGGSFL